MRITKRTSAGITGRVGLSLATLGVALCGPWLVGRAFADDGEIGIEQRLTTELQARWPGTRVVLNDAPTWDNPSGFAEVVAAGNSSIQILSDQGQGEVHFAVGAGRSRVSGKAVFSALKTAWIPSRRIQPAEALHESDFTLREVDVSRSPVREMRGILLEPTTHLEKLEARQTLLEGTPVVSTAVQLQPAVKRGASLRVEITSGEIILSTQATAMENGTTGSNLRIMTDKQKRELVGKLREDGVVEVSL